jgi:RimJ/RimL family protein N-acetyltransferase
VLPVFRSQRIHATRHILALESLFQAGVRRVYVEAFEDNVYTWHGHRRAGYREFGRIHVKRRIGGKQYVRWL